jgi:hypothetical protein
MSADDLLNAPISAPNTCPGCGASPGDVCPKGGCIGVKQGADEWQEIMERVREIMAVAHAQIDRISNINRALRAGREHAASS